MKLTHRQATREDLPELVALLAEDELGKTRESHAAALDTNYDSAFKRIAQDPNQYLMVVECDHKIVATCHLTLMPSLTYQGALRMQIEAVRVASAYRGKHIGSWMLRQAKHYAVQQGATILQLTTNKQRALAKHFYEKHGFIASHEGMKLILEN